MARSPDRRRLARIQRALLRTADDLEHLETVYVDGQTRDLLGQLLGKVDAMETEVERDGR